MRTSLLQCSASKSATNGNISTEQDGTKPQMVRPTINNTMLSKGRLQQAMLSRENRSALVILLTTGQSDCESMQEWLGSASSLAST